MIKTNVCELCAVEIITEHTANGHDQSKIVITRIKNVGTASLHDIINNAPEAHKEEILNTSIYDDDKVSLTIMVG